MPKKFQIEVKDDDPAQTGSAWREIARKREAEIIRLRTRVAELEASLDAMTARAAINGKEGLRYRDALERSELILLRIALGTTGNTHWQDLASTAADEAHQVLHPE